MAGKVDYDIFAKFPNDCSDEAECLWALIWFMEATGLISYEDLDYAYYNKDFSAPKYIQNFSKHKDQRGR